MFKKITLILACILGLGFAPMASADGDHRSIVVDKEGKFVKNTFGNCVRTQWSVGKDNCKDVLMMMDERIVYFDFDKYGLKPSEKMKLDVLIDVIKIIKFNILK